jgi:hypothetical protein
MRRDLTWEMPPGRIASSTSSRGASRAASQEGKRSRSWAQAASRLRSFVLCESTVSISSSSASPWGAHPGRP